MDEIIPQNKRSGSWHLVHVCEGDADKSDDTKIIAISSLTKDGKCVLHEDSRIVDRAISKLHIADAVYANLEELLGTVAQAGTSGLNNPVLQPGFKYFPKEMGRRLLNLCASFNSMIKHQDAYLNRRYGKTSIEVENWNSLKFFLLRTRIEYGLMYGLRNYIEHVDLPPIYCNVHGREDGVVRVNIELERDAFLMKEARLGREITRQLKAQPKRIPLLPMLDKWHEVFQEIAQHILGLHAGEIQRSALSVSDIRIRYDIPAHGEIGFWLVPEIDKNPNSLNIQITWISDRNAQRLCELMKWGAKN